MHLKLRDIDVATSPGQRSVAELGGADVKQIDKKEECTVEVKGIDVVVYDVADMSRAIKI